MECDDCITVHALQRALYLHAFCPIVTGLLGAVQLLHQFKSNMKGNVAVSYIPKF